MLRKKWFTIFLVAILSVMNVPFSALATEDVDVPEFHSAEVSKNELAAGEEVTLSIDASDVVSGIDKVMAVYKYKDSYEAILVELYYNETNSKYETKLDVEKLNLKGIWFVDEIIITDKKTNSLRIFNGEPDVVSGNTLTLDLSHLHINVLKIGTDITSPEFHGIEVDKNEVTAGDELKVSVEASDLESGIDTIEVIYKNKYSNDGFLINLHYSKDSRKYEGYSYINNSTFGVNGPWVIDHILITDKQDNKFKVFNKTAHPTPYESITLDLSQVDLMVSGMKTSDRTAPEFNSIKIDKNVVSGGDVIKISVDANDVGSGIKSINLIYQYKYTMDGHFIDLFYNDSSDRYEGLLEVNAMTLGLNGPWNVVNIEITDYSENKLIVFNKTSYPSPYKTISLDLSHVDIIVAGNDLTPPEFHGIEVDKREGRIGEEIKIIVDARDKQSGVSHVDIRLLNENFIEYREIQLKLNESSQKFEHTIVVDENLTLGRWIVEYITIHDKNSNALYLANRETQRYNPDAIDISDGDFIIVDGTAPEKPEVYTEVSDQSTEILGNAEAGSTVVVVANEMVIGSGLADNDNLFRISIDIQKAGTVLSITATDSVGNVSEATEVVVKDVTAPDNPQVNEVTNLSTEVTGTAESGSIIEVSVGGAVIESGTSEDNGAFSINIPIQKAGTILSITSIDEAGNVSMATEVVVTDITVPDKPQVNEVTDQSIEITGATEAGSTIHVMVDVAIVGWGIAEEDGLFTISIPVLPAGTTLSIIAIDQGGNVSEVTEVVVKDVTAPDKPQVNEVTNQSKEVTGQAEANSNIEIFVDGDVIGSGTAKEDGLFSVSIPVQKAGTSLSINATDQAGNVSKTTEVVVKDVTAPDTPQVNEVTDQSKEVTGKAEANSNIEISIEGEIISSGTTKEDGVFSVSIPVQKAGTILSITATDQAGNVSEAETISVKPELQEWVPIDGKWYYFDPVSGEKITGWSKINGIWYYFTNNGEMQIGWNQINGKWYYLTNSGAMETGWKKIGSTWYFLGASGEMHTGWTKIGSSWYYLENSGAMQTGWTKVSNTWYYLADSGEMQTGWINLGGTWYYLANSGAMQTGWSKVGSSWYYHSSSGAMQVGWVKTS